jgi:transposase
MGAPLFPYLRERVVEAAERGGLSRNQAARHFGVAVSTANTYGQCLHASHSLRALARFQQPNLWPTVKQP